MAETALAKGRSTSFTGDVADLAACIRPTALRRGKVFLPQPANKKDIGNVIVANREMWAAVRLLESSLSFTKKDAEKAMAMVLEECESQWTVSLRSDAERKDWITVCGARFRSQCRLIACCRRAHPDTKWYKRLWSTVPFSETAALRQHQTRRRRRLQPRRAASCQSSTTCSWVSIGGRSKRGVARHRNPWPRRSARA
jgi:hypothetical protein